MENLKNSNIFKTDMRKKLKTCLCILLFLIFFVSPVKGSVQDNLDSSFTRLATLIGLGKEENIPTDQESFYQASLVEKINFIETQNAQLKNENAAMRQQLLDMNTKLDTIYMAAAANAYNNSQVKSTKVTKASPTQLLVKWDCTKDSDCTSNAANAERIDDSNIKEFHVYYSSVDASVRNMVYAGTVAYNSGKLYTSDYEYVISKLSPDTTYYVWVTAVINDADNTELTDNSNVRVMKTHALKDAAVTTLTTSPSNGTTLSVSWKDGLTGTTTKSTYVDHYNIYWSTSALTASNVASCSKKNTSTSCSASITGLTAGTTYYVAVAPVMKDTTAGNSGLITASLATKTATTVAIGDFSTLSWKDIQTCLDASCLEMESWDIGDCKDGWYIIGMTKNVAGTKDELRLWRKTTNLGNNNWSSTNATAQAYYTTFNSTYGITGAYSSGLLSYTDVTSGWLASNRTTGSYYWLETANSSGGHWLVDSDGNVYSYNDSYSYGCYPHVWLR